VRITANRKTDATYAASRLDVVIVPDALGDERAIEALELGSKLLSSGLADPLHAS
jgi:hypothetical protein